MYSFPRSSGESNQCATVLGNVSSILLSQGMFPISSFLGNVFFVHISLVLYPISCYLRDVPHVILFWILFYMSYYPGPTILDIITHAVLYWELSSKFVENTFHILISLGICVSHVLPGYNYSSHNTLENGSHLLILWEFTKFSTIRDIVSYVLLWRMFPKWFCNPEECF